MNSLLAVKLLKPSIRHDDADCMAEFALWMENRSRYCEQSAQTKAGARAELPERELAPLLGNEWWPV